MGKVNGCYIRTYHVVEGPVGVPWSKVVVSLPEGGSSRPKVVVLGEEDFN